jgi:hypothetical protein
MQAVIQQTQVMTGSILTHQVQAECQWQLKRGSRQMCPMLAISFQMLVISFHEEVVGDFHKEHKMLREPQIQKELRDSSKTCQVIFSHQPLRDGS